MANVIVNVRQNLAGQNMIFSVIVSTNILIDGLLVEFTTIKNQSATMAKMKWRDTVIVNVLGSFHAANLKVWMCEKINTMHDSPSSTTVNGFVYKTWTIPFTVKSPFGCVTVMRNSTRRDSCVHWNARSRSCRPS